MTEPVSDLSIDYLRLTILGWWGMGSIVSAYIECGLFEASDDFGQLGERGDYWSSMRTLRLLPVSKTASKEVRHLFHGLSPSVLQERSYLHLDEDAVYRNDDVDRSIAVIWLATAVDNLGFGEEGDHVIHNAGLVL